MKPAKFDYHAPADIEGVLDLLARHREEAKLLAGGQTLVPAMNFRLARPKVLIDLNRVGRLAGIHEEANEIVIGAMTRQRTIEESGLVRELVPLLHEATHWIAHLPIRTRGTIGGSLAHADPAAEDPAVVCALDAVIVARSVRGERRIAATDFFRGLLTTALAVDELLIAIRFPKSKPGTGAAFAEISRRHGDFALAGVAAQIVPAAGRTGEVRLAACGVGAGPVRMKKAEALLAGAALSVQSIDAAAADAMHGIAPLGDLHGSADYRGKLVRAMARDALMLAAQRAGLPIAPGGTA